MPHKNPQASQATAQNAATDPLAPNDQARGQHRSVRAEPRSYAAPDVADATVALPAAGEITDYMDEGDALEGDVQSGGDRGERPYETEARRDQGPKTRAANREIVKGRPRG